MEHSISHGVGAGQHQHHSLPSVMSLWTETRKMYVAHFKSIAKFIGVFVAFALVFMVLSALIASSIIGFSSVPQLENNDVAFMGILALLFTLGLVVRIILGLTQHTFPYFTIKFLDNVAHHQELSPSRVVRSMLSWRWLGSFLWFSACLMAAVIGGSVLFFIPGLIIGVYMTFARFTFVLDRKHGLHALTQSWWYVHGRFWVTVRRSIAVMFFASTPLLAYILSMLIICALIVVAFDVHSEAAAEAFFISAPLVNLLLATFFVLIGVGVALFVAYPLAMIGMYTFFVKARLIAGQPTTEFVRTRRNFLKAFALFGAVMWIAAIVTGFFMEPRQEDVVQSTTMNGYVTYHSARGAMAFLYPETWEITPLELRGSRTNVAVHVGKGISDDEGEYAEVTSIDFAQALAGKELTKDKIVELLTFLIKQKIQDPEMHGLDPHTPLSATITTTPYSYNGAPRVYAEGVLTIKDTEGGADHHFSYKSEMILKNQRLYMIFYTCTPGACTPGVYSSIANSLEI